MNIRLNLLPEEKKAEVRRARDFRFILWQGVSLVFLAAAYLGILEGVHAALGIRLQEVGQAGRTAETEALGEIQAYENLFQETNRKVSGLDRLQKEHLFWSNALAQLEAAVPDGIVLERLLTNEAVLSLAGKAATRDALLGFQSSLNGSECFSGAKVPLSDLFSQKDIDFQIEVEVRQECLKPKNL
jgi:Tfp pilus assembly protein PilN